MIRVRGKRLRFGREDLEGLRGLKGLDVNGGLKVEGGSGELERLEIELLGVWKGELRAVAGKGLQRGFERKKEEWGGG